MVKLPLNLTGSIISVEITFPFLSMAVAWLVHLSAAANQVKHRLSPKQIISRDFYRNMDSFKQIPS